MPKSKSCAFLNSNGQRTFLSYDIYIYMYAHILHIKQSLLTRCAVEKKSIYDFRHEEIKIIDESSYSECVSHANKIWEMEKANFVIDVNEDIAFMKPCCNLVDKFYNIYQR